MTPSYTLVWDLETVPDLEAAARMLHMEGVLPDEVRAALGDGFPKLPLHKIVCIGALIAKREGDAWAVERLGAPHIGERSEAELISGFVDKIGELKPTLVTFNGGSFDLPVLRYRAMVNRVSAAGLLVRNYFHRYGTDAIDLCDVLASFNNQNKMRLDDLARILGLPGKPDGVDGSMVEPMVNEGRISEVAAYCESDVVNTYRVWLAYELFRGELSEAGHHEGEERLRAFLTEHSANRPHLGALL